MLQNTSRACLLQGESSKHPTRSATREKSKQNKVLFRTIFCEVRKMSTSNGKLYKIIKYRKTYLPHVAALHVLRALWSLWHSVCAPRTLLVAVLWAPRFVSPAPWCVHQSDGQFLEAPPHLAFRPPSASSQGVKFVKWGEHVKNKFRTSLNIWRNGMITEEREL